MENFPVFNDIRVVMTDLLSETNSMSFKAKGNDDYHAETKQTKHSRNKVQMSSCSTGL